MKIYYVAFLIISAVLLYLFSQFWSDINTSINSTYFGDSVGYLLPNTTEELTNNIFGIISSIVRKFNEGALSFNTLIVISGLFTFYCGYFLFKHISGDKKQTKIYLLGALLITLAPIRMRYAMEWPNHSNWGWMLLYITFLVMLLKTLTKSNLKISILVGALFGVSLIEDIYQGLILAFVSIPIILINFFIIFRKMGSKITFRLALAKLIIIFIMSASFIAYEYVNLSNTKVDTPNATTSVIVSAKREQGDKWAYSARPWHYLIPDISHPIMGKSAVKLQYWIWTKNPHYLTEVFFPKEHSLFLGYTLMSLSFFIVCKLYVSKKVNKRLNYYVQFFLIIGLAAFILSMPPYVGLGKFKIYFPSHFIYQFLPQFRAYARFGIVVFISNLALAMIGLSYITENVRKKYGIVKSNLLFLGISMLTIVEFINFFPFQSITTTATPAYAWMLNKKEDFSYIEIPRRNDYSDHLYTSGTNIKILNPYLVTPKNVEEIEKSLWDINRPFATPESLWCVNFRELNGKYIFYHKKELNKDKVVQDFVETKVVTDQLKVALAESWGQPIWGNHVQKTEEDLKNDQRKIDMEMLLRTDPKFTVVKKFLNEEIIASRPNKNFSADKFDEVIVFEINEDYCNNIKSENMEDLDSIEADKVTSD